MPRKPDTPLMLGSRDTPNIVSINRVGARTSSNTSLDAGLTEKQPIRPPQVQPDYSAGLERKIPITQSDEENRKNFDWLTWGIGFLCGGLTMWMILRP